MSLSSKKSALSVRVRASREFSLASLIEAEGLSFDGLNLVQDEYPELNPVKGWELSQLEMEAILDARESCSWQQVCDIMLVEKSYISRYVAGNLYSHSPANWGEENTPENRQKSLEMVPIWIREGVVRSRLRRGIREFSRESIREMDVTPGALAHLGLSKDWEAKRFLNLYQQLYVKGRPWGSCYQPNKRAIKALGLTPNYNRLPLWVKQVLINSPQWIQTQRVGDIWKLIPAARAWKVCPDLPKAIAVRIGKMPLWKRLAASSAWKSLHTDWCWYSREVRDGRSDSKLWACFDEEAGGARVEKSEVILEFWKRFNTLCKQGMDAALIASEDLPRAIAIKNKGINSDTARFLIALLYSGAEGMPQSGSVESNAVSLLCGLKMGVLLKALSPVLERHERENYKISLRLAKQGVEDCWEYKSQLALTLVFAKEAERWLSKQSSLGRGLHDATYWLPIAPTRSLEGLSKWLFKFGDRNVSELEIVAKRWHELDIEARSLPYKELVAYCRSQKYLGAKHLEFACEAGKWAVSQSDYRSYEARFMASQNVPVPFPTDIAWTNAGVEGRFLPRSDVRGLFLGQYTNCCQHPDGVGARCAWYGQESPNSGFFVWESNGEIIAQSWCWISDNGGLCFDNVEAKGLGSRKESVANVLAGAAKELSEKFHSVTLGTGLSDLPTHHWQQAVPLQVPRDYSGYCDSTSQVKLACNPILPKQKVFNVPAWVRGALSQDLEACEAIARECYPEGWQFVSVDAYSYGLVLQSSDGILGYAILDITNKRIDDIAVLPKHRKHSMLLVQEVIRQCRIGGGKWECEARESTSFKLLKLLERRGKVKIFSESPTSDMKGEKMYKVIFLPKITSK